MTRLKFSIISLIIFMALFSCSSKKIPDTITLKLEITKGQTKKLIGKYVYLSDLTHKGSLDSVLVKSKTAIFNLKADSAFSPHIVSVKYFDTAGGHPYLRPFGFKYQNQNDQIFSSFYIDIGMTIIKTYSKENSEESSFVGSKENETFLKQISLRYPIADPLKTKDVIDMNISIIKSFPSSIYLLEQLFHFKEYFSNNELKNQLSFFDRNIKNKILLKRFDDYFLISSTYDKSFPSTILLEDQNGNYQKVGDDNAAYNLIVYWASWCGPCREEIPELKELNTKFKDRGLHITNISIDEVRSKWNNAVEQEKMPWQQLIAIDSTRRLIDLHYNIKAIPRAYLFNHKKELVKIYKGDKSTITNEINTLLNNGN